MGDEDVALRPPKAVSATAPSYPCAYCDYVAVTQTILGMHQRRLHASALEAAAAAPAPPASTPARPSPRPATTAGRPSPPSSPATTATASATSTSPRPLLAGVRPSPAGPLSFGGSAPASAGAGPLSFGGAAASSNASAAPAGAGPLSFGGAKAGSGEPPSFGNVTFNFGGSAFTTARATPAADSMASPASTKPPALAAGDDDDDENPFPVGPAMIAQSTQKAPAATVPASSAAAANALAAAVDSALKTSDGPPAAGEGAMDVEKNVNGLIQTLQNVEVNLAEQQADVNSPLYSAQTFEELNLPEPLLRGLYAMGFHRPSKIQERALPLLLRNGPNGRPGNLIAQSQAGTGKTAAFALCMLGRTDETVAAVQALCIAPTRELARQIGDVVTQMAKFTKITVFMAVKDRDGAGSASSGAVRDHIVIGTPGTVSDLLAKRRINIQQLRVFAVDEADDMLDRQGMGDQTAKIRRQVPDTCQILLFSATYPTEVRDYALRMVPNANTISLKRARGVHQREELALNNIQQFFVQCRDEQDKINFLSKIYGLLTVGSSIIFCNRKTTCNRLTQHMQNEGYTVATLHGDLLPDERDRVMESFRKGTSKVLIATNVLSRGIDVLQVSLVINFDLPSNETGAADLETYLHRIGRTGRFGRSGCAINFVHDRSSMGLLEEVKRAFGKPINELPADPEKLEAQLQSVGKA